MFKDSGPGVLVAAAFIGPGTVTMCTIAGAQFQFVLLWAMFFSVFSTIILQEMSARLGLVSQKGLAQAVSEQIHKPFARWIALALIMSALLIGNAAYEAGNISGGVLGLETLFTQPLVKFQHVEVNLFSLAIGLFAFILLWIGNYKIIETTLIILVLLMSFSFVLTAIMTTPDIFLVLKGLLIPQIPI